MEKWTVFIGHTESKTMRGGLSMQHEEIKTEILKDNYIKIAYHRYLKFKKSSLYDEVCKLVILEKLNGYMRNNTLSETSVLDVAKRSQKSNPTKGFVHWNHAESPYINQKVFNLTRSLQVEGSNLILLLFTFNMLHKRAVHQILFSLYYRYMKGMLALFLFILWVYSYVYMVV